MKRSITRVFSKLKRGINTEQAAEENYWTGGVHPDKRRKDVL